MIDESKIGDLSSEPCPHFEASFQTVRLLGHISPDSPWSHSHTPILSLSLRSVPGGNPAPPYLLHRLLNDHVPHWDEDASQDGYHRSKHGSGDQPAPSVTASHGGVRFYSPPPSKRAPLSLPASMCCSSASQLQSRAGPSGELTELLRPEEGAHASRRGPRTPFK